jgi:hypothetical protein
MLISVDLLIPFTTSRFIDFGSLSVPLIVRRPDRGVRPSRKFAALDKTELSHFCKPVTLKPTDGMDPRSHSSFLVSGGFSNQLKEVAMSSIPRPQSMQCVLAVSLLLAIPPALIVNAQVPQHLRLELLRAQLARARFRTAPERVPCVEATRASQTSELQCPAQRRCD